MARRFPIGEIVEIETPLGLLYAQATAYSGGPFGHGPLYRVPTEVFREKPQSLPDHPSIAAFSPLHVAVENRYPAVEFRRIGKRPVPAVWEGIPVFKAGRIDPRSLESYTVLWDGTTDQPVDGRSEDELAAYPPLRSGGPYSLVYWALEAAVIPQDHPTLAGWFGLDGESAQSGSTSHHLLFPTEAAALAAAEQLSDVGTVKLSGGGGRWLVQVDVAGGRFQSLDDAEAALESVAEAFGGDYDGNDVAV